MTTSPPDQARSLRTHFDPGSAASSMDLPVPHLEVDFRMSVKLQPKVPVGPTPFGFRNWIGFTSGQWSATWGRGTLVVSPRAVERQPHAGEASCVCSEP